MNFRYKDLQVAVKKAYDLSFRCVGKEDDLWVVFDHLDGGPDGVKPDIFCMFSGVEPVANTIVGEEMIQLMLKNPADFPDTIPPSLLRDQVV